MYTKMYTLNLIAVVFLHCVCIFTSGTDGHYFGSSVSILDHAISDGYPLLGIGESLQKFLDDDWDIEPGCSCLNGKCEKQCVKEKDGVCRKTANVCVCDAEFFKINDETCIYCGCGEGFNCTFYHTSRTCVCPEGFHVLENKCAAMCNEKQPCQNGGKCIENKCECKPGTSGTFCESADLCKKTCNKPLLAECVYNEERDDISCLCKDRSLVYDFQERICKPCTCKQGTCEVQNGTLTCRCEEGYQPFNMKCILCVCGRDGICEITENGESTCKCKDGDFSRGGRCLPCDCGHEEAKCQTDKVGRKQCICPFGYEVILGKCVKMNRDDRRCLCHPTAQCIETFSDSNEFNCTCKEGYKGKVHDVPQFGEECVDIDECQDLKSCPDRETTECLNFEGSFMCRCKTGYRPAGMTVDSPKIECKKYKKSWAPTGIVIAIILVFIGTSVGALLYLKKRSTFFSPSPAIELQNADYKR